MAIDDGYWGLGIWLKDMINDLGYTGFDMALDYWTGLDGRTDWTDTATEWRISFVLTNSIPFVNTSLGTQVGGEMCFGLEFFTFFCFSSFFSSLSDFY